MHDICVYRACCTLHAWSTGGKLLHDHEWAAYTAAHASGSTALRMAVAALLAGEEVCVCTCVGVVCCVCLYMYMSGGVFYVLFVSAVVECVWATQCATYPQQNNVQLTPTITPLYPYAPPQEEARFWLLLPTTLASLSTHPSHPNTPDSNIHTPLLWDAHTDVSHCEERIHWHETMRLPLDDPHIQELRTGEYVSLGDFATAVGHLLASTPEHTARYYRDALMTLALASAAVVNPHDGGGGEGGADDGGARGDAGGDDNGEGVLHDGPQGGPPTAHGQRRSTPPTGQHMKQHSQTLLTQAAKVITANAASVGDSRLGIPLLCSIGRLLCV